MLPVQKSRCAKHVCRPEIPQLAHTAKHPLQSSHILSAVPAFLPLNMEIPC